MWGLRLAACAVAALAAIAPARADDRPTLTNAQKLAVYAKPSVVRVVAAYTAKFSFQSKTGTASIGGTGSGFFVSPDGYIATNAHVVQAIHDGDDKAKDALLERAREQVIDAYKDQLTRMPRDQAVAILRQVQLVEMKRFAFVILPNGEHLQYDVKAYGAPIGEGKDCAIIKVVTDNAPTIAIGDSTKVQVQDRILVVGYPGVADLGSVGDDKSQLEASITDGTVSAIKHTSDGEQVIQTNASITHGNSGGPAIDERGEVIGLATFASSKEVQGFNFLVSSQMVMEFVRQAGAKPEPSVANQLWREALELFWDDEYSDAIKKLEELLQVYPAHSEAAAFIRQARTAVREGKDKKKSGNVALVIGLVVGGLVLAALAIVVVRKSGKRAPAAAAGLQPVAMLPQQPMPPMPQQAMPMQPMPPMQQPLPPMQQPLPAQPGLMMAGGVAPQPIAKTFAVNAARQAGQVAPTAFASLAVGSLTCTRGALVGHRFSLTPTGIIVGRQPGVAHVLVNDHRASGKHVWIGMDNGKLVAIDQGTTNGTYVNDVGRGRISRVELRDGDVVIVGEPDCCSLQVKVG